MNIMGTEYRNDITPEYVQENIEGIIEVMSSMLPSSAQQPANWKRALKKEDSYKNITYIGYIILHKDLKRHNSFGQRVNSLYDKEELIDERIERENELILKREKEHKGWRKVFMIVTDELKVCLNHNVGLRYEQFVNENLSEFNRGYYGF